MEPQTLSTSSELCRKPDIENDFSIVSCSSTGRSRSELLKDTGNAEGRRRSSGIGAEMFVTSCWTRPGFPYCAIKEMGNRLPSVNTVKKRAFRMSSSSIQLASCPLHALPHRGIQIGRMLKRVEVLSSSGVSPLQQEIDQCHLHQGRLLPLQRVQNALVYLGLPSVAA